MRIGLISDTHDLLRPEALRLLEGVDHVVHCGDVCHAALLDELRGIAPLHAVRGNCDHGDWAQELPLTETVELGGIVIHARHILAALDLDPGAAGVSLVLYGHTHTPHTEKRDGILYVNPGSAGPRRFSLPISMGFLTVTDDGEFEVELQEIL